MSRQRCEDAPCCGHNDFICGQTLGMPSIYREEEPDYDAQEDFYLRLDNEIEWLCEKVEEAFEDVRGDNPDAEAGWELDVARSVLATTEGPERAKNEVWRMHFGSVKR